MKRFLAALAVSIGLAVPAGAQDLIDLGWVAGWSVMKDPQMGGGCLIQTVYQDLSVVRLGYDATNKRGYFVVFNRGWGDIKTGETYNVRFDLDGERFDRVAEGVRLDKVPGAIVFFDDRAFVEAIAKRKHMIVYGQSGEAVMKIDLAGTDEAISYARECKPVTN